MKVIVTQEATSGVPIVKNAETGEVLEGVSSVDILLRPGSLPTIRMTLFGDVSIEADVKDEDIKPPVAVCLECTRIYADDGKLACRRCR